MIGDLLSWPCTVVHRSLGAADEYNDPQLQETRTAGYCYWEMQRGGEKDDKGATEHMQVTVFMAPDVAGDIAAIDAVELDGGPEVESWGEPHGVVNARTGQLHHVEMIGRVTR